MSLTNPQYDEIMRSYQEKQRLRQRLIAQRQAALFEQSPRFEELNRTIASLSVSCARRLIDGDSAALLSLKEEISSLSAQKARLLSSLGYPADYLEPPYQCPDCQDTGYVSGKRCHCFLQASIDLVYAQSNLTSMLETENFSTFSFSHYADDIYAPGMKISSLDAAKNAFSKCWQFVQQFDTEYRNLLLFGNTGVGKTFLSHCIAKELLDSGHSVIYFSAPRFFDVLAAHAFQRDAAATIDYHNIFSCDLLIIDDLGTEVANSFTSSQFFVCLNERLMQKKSTLISSNLNLQDIANIYSERIFSRISSNFLLLQLFGNDIRIQKNLLI